MEKVERLTVPMLYFSSLIQTNPTYKPAADRLFAALDLFNIKYNFIYKTKDIWLRDFMPTKTKSGEYVSFRYEPGYLTENSELKTDFRQNIVPQFPLPIIYSHINLDGGNIVFSPSKEKAVISDRIYSENTQYTKDELIKQLEKLLGAQVIIIPSDKKDMTGHADGMVRFIDENTVIGNYTSYKNGLEQRIKRELKKYGINTIDFPYFYSPNNSAVGCYINYLETEQAVFLPVFGINMDNEAIGAAKSLFNKTIVPVNINEIAKDGGVLNCISWEE